MSKQPEGAQVDGLKLPISRLVLGTMTFGDTADEATAGRMVDEALDAGITTIDTANAYVGRRHRGDARPAPEGNARRRHPGLQGRHAARGPRLHTRRCRRQGCATAWRAACAGWAWTASTCSTCTSRTGPRPCTKPWPPWPSSLPRGRSARWACPTSPPGRSPTSSTWPAKWGRRGPSSRSSSTTWWPAGVEEEYLEFAATHNVHTMVYNPLGGGLLTGKHSFDAKPTEGRYGDSKLAAMYTQRYWDKQLFDADRRAVPASPRTPASPSPSCPCAGSPTATASGSMLLGGSKVEQLQANIAAVANGPAAGRRRGSLRRRGRRAPRPHARLQPLTRFSPEPHPALNRTD